MDTLRTHRPASSSRVFQDAHLAGREIVRSGPWRRSIDGALQEFATITSNDIAPTVPWLATASRDKTTVRIWDTSSGKQVHTLPHNRLVGDRQLPLGR
jgi:WD40 repeat protein